MKEKIIGHFTTIGRFKIVFNPAIKVQAENHVQPIWIDDISMANKRYVLTVSTKDDNCKKLLEDLTADELEKLEYRLNQMVGQLNQQPA